MRRHCSSMFNPVAPGAGRRRRRRRIPISFRDVEGEAKRVDSLLIFIFSRHLVNDLDDSIQNRPDIPEVTWKKKTQWYNLLLKYITIDDRMKNVVYQNDNKFITATVSFKCRMTHEKLCHDEKAKSM